MPINDKRERSIWERKRYQKRIKDGLCHKCGRKRGKKRADRTTCRTCGEKENTRLTALYHKRRAAEQ